MNQTCIMLVLEVFYSSAFNKGNVPFFNSYFFRVATELVCSQMKDNWQNLHNWKERKGGIVASNHGSL